jgi:hypothetical protein
MARVKNAAPSKEQNSCCGKDTNIGLRMTISPFAFSLSYAFAPMNLSSIARQVAQSPYRIFAVVSAKFDSAKRRRPPCAGNAADHIAADSGQFFPRGVTVG